VSGQAQWRLVAPWYRWPAEGVQVGGVRVRETWPALQKYATSNPVGEFVKAPQHSLKFLDPEDRYEIAQMLAPLKALPPPLDTVRRRLTDTQLVSTSIRKLYLDSHRRFYLVVVQLIWDQPGYPCVDPARVCQQGFVIRRRRFLVDRSAIDRGAIEILRKVVAERRRHQHLSRFIEYLAKGERSVPSGVRPEQRLSATALLKLAEVDAEVSGALAREQARMLAWAQESGIGFQLEGWIPGLHQNIGSWQPIADSTPPDVTEEIYPLFPLVPDPADVGHDGHDSSIYFGLVPTGGSDVEDDGTPRFDDQSLYDIRCFVRRHDERCPRTEHVPDCFGPLVWSLPSEAYRLAAPLDLTGTSNHAITIQAPDMPALAAKAGALGKAAAGVRVVTPPSSSLQFRLPSPPGVPGAGSVVGSGDLCFFMIPLFTLVALFLFNLFLPILLLIFQVWWMLALKLCIPPSVGADVGANLQAELNELQVNLGVDVNASVSIDDQFATLAANLTFRNGMLLDHLKSELGDANAAAKLEGQYSTDALVRLHQAMAELATAPRSLTARLQFEDDPHPVLRSQVVLV